MKKYGWPLIISAGLVVLAHYLFNQPLGGGEWMAARGYDAENPPPFDLLPFLVEYIGWIAYSYFFMWLYRKVQYTTIKDAMTLSLLLWAFVAFPVVTIHYIFLGYSTTLILLDGASTLLAFWVAGNLLWALSIHSAPGAAQPATA